MRQGGLVRVGCYAELVASGQRAASVQGPDKTIRQSVWKWDLFL